MKHNWIKLRPAFTLNAKDPRCWHQLIWSTGGPERSLFRYFEKKWAHLRECTIHKVVSETKSEAGCSHVGTNPTCIVISDQREADEASIEGREAPVPKIVAKSVMPPPSLPLPTKHDEPLNHTHWKVFSTFSENSDLRPFEFFFRKHFSMNLGNVELEDRI